MSDLGRRRRVMHVSCDMFLGLFCKGVRPGYEVIADAIPDSAIVADVLHSGFTARMAILIECPEFDPVPEGSPWPEMEPVLREIQPTPATFPHPDDDDAAQPGLMARAGVEPAGTEYRTPKDTRLS